MNKFQFNPFKENRAEQMKDLWKYYVEFIDDSSFKPLRIEGGRGSGKTMFFKCNSWREQLSKYLSYSTSESTFLTNTKFIGLYYRVDATFTSQIPDDIKGNNNIFNRYLTLVLLQNVVLFFKELVIHKEISESDLLPIIMKYSAKLYRVEKILTIDEFLSIIDIGLDEIENETNGEVCKTSFRNVNLFRYLEEICKDFIIVSKQDFSFKVFIDEYESLKINQQKLVNTLIKQSNTILIFNIGLKPYGQKTDLTVNDERIEYPNDYDIKELITANFADYEEKILEICKKRMALYIDKFNITDDLSIDIRDYLSEYSLEDEVDKIKDYNFKFIDELKDIIKTSVSDSDIYDYHDIINELCDKKNLIISRVIHMLCSRESTNKQSFLVVYDNYINKTEQFSNWLNNMKMGVVFSLSKEANKLKIYSGFQTITALSSGNIRYFLELIEKCFDFHYLEHEQGFFKDKISPETQSSAILSVSEYKIRDVNHIPKYGKELRVFLQSLGLLFNKLQFGDYYSLKEPEVNHFYTNDLQINPEIKEKLCIAVSYNILNEHKPTKRKSTDSKETTDYYLSKILIPYFGISYRNKRKIFIDNEMLRLFFSGNFDVASKSIEDYRKKQVNQNNIRQISIFDSLGEYDG
jgi:hypothetical protein